MIHKEVIGNELYVWMNGSLLYKRWLNVGYGMIFCPVFQAYRASEADNWRKFGKCSPKKFK